MSSYSALAAKGELTVAERVGDVSLGEDMLQYTLHKICTLDKTVRWLNFTSARRLNGLLLGLLSSKFSAPFTVNPVPQQITK